MNKKIFTIIISIALVIIISIVIYLIFKTKQYPQDQPAPPNQTTANLNQLLKNKMLSPVLDTSEQSILYFNLEGKKDIGFYKYSLASQQESLISPFIPPANKAIWSPDKTKAILTIIYHPYSFENFDLFPETSELEDGIEYTWVYNLTNQKITLLNPDIESINWSIDGNKVIYRLYNLKQNINNISSSNSDGSQEEKIIDLDTDSEIFLAPLSPDELYYHSLVYETALGTNIFKLNLDTKKITRINQNPVVINTKLFPNHQALLFDYYNNNNKQYGLAAIWLNQDKKIDYKIKANVLDTTFTSDNKFLITAISTENNTSDKLYKINIETGEIIELQYDTPEGEVIKPENLMITQDNQTLYFTSYDILYKLEL